VLWEKGVPRDLGNFGGDRNAAAVGVNNRTEVVGASPRASGGRTARKTTVVLAMIPLGAPSSINNSRQVVGGSCDPNLNCRAFLWERYSMMDLSDLAPDDSPLYLVFATWINDVGEIVGFGVDKKTEEIRAFLARHLRCLVTKSQESLPRSDPTLRRSASEITS
jgi:probable HAF family extracellular repeat protein